MDTFGAEGDPREFRFSHSGSKDVTEGIEREPRLLLLDDECRRLVGLSVKQIERKVSSYDVAPSFERERVIEELGDGE